VTESPDYRLEILDSIHDIGAASWNRIVGADPFLRHQFLSAMEESGCVGPATNWRPSHLLLKDRNGELAGMLPLYLKFDSRGEFVFDWSWADAYERAGIDYYPKLVSAIPYTPATSLRLLIRDTDDANAIAAKLLAGAQDLAERLQMSSLHILFPDYREHGHYERAGLLPRKGCQFHWRNDAYANFDEFLSRFSSAKRKKANRERRRIREAGIAFEHLHGAQVSPCEWDAIYEFYSRTFLRRGRQPYLNRAFFEQVAATMPESLVVILARYEQRPIATAICFRSDDTLYGRYWGSLADFHSLHFEACYYQGIDYCIAEGLRRFEPGTQGEHKVSRGFSPTATWSYHWLAEAAFRDPIKDFLQREADHIDAYMDDLNDHLPYRRDGFD
jgi:predicted N-acyltransferase